MKNSAILKQAIGNRDTKHGLLDLPVTVGKAMKKPKLRFGAGGLLGEMVAGAKRAWEGKKEDPPKEAPKKEVPKAASTAAPRPIRDLPDGATRIDSTIEGWEGTVKKAKGGTVRCRDGCAIRGKTRGAMR